MLNESHPTTVPYQRFQKAAYQACKSIPDNPFIQSSAKTSPRLRHLWRSVLTHLLKLFGRSRMSYYCGGYRSYYPCNSGLNRGARIGIGVAIAVGVVLLVILFSLVARRRRRRFLETQPTSTIPMHQQNQPSHYQQGYGGGGGYGQPYGQPYGQQPYTGQAYGLPSGGTPANNGGDASLYAPPPGPPPPAYVPRDDRKPAESNNV